MNGEIHVHIFNVVVEGTVNKCKELRKSQEMREEWKGVVGRTVSRTQEKEGHVSKGTNLGLGSGCRGPPDGFWQEIQADPSLSKVCSSGYSWTDVPCTLQTEGNVTLPSSKPWLSVCPPTARAAVRAWLGRGHRPRPLHGLRGCVPANMWFINTTELWSNNAPG